MDFLSFLSMKEKASNACLVLNSVANIYRAIDYLQRKSITKVRAFLDNDEAGRQAIQLLQSSGLSVEDMSRFYPHHKDLNDFHIQRELKKLQASGKRTPKIKR
ncbi:toprim domain-containing protein [Bacteroides sp. KG68]|uniref:toprim domain-containing protein n=1 Tax=unclassified Bacteroides TaxID=2646097 RepID=UPI003D957E02